MRKVATIKSATFFIVFFMVPLLLFAQEKKQDTYTFEFRGESLSNALDHVAQETGIDLVYDPDLVRDIYVYEEIEEQPVKTVLKEMLAETEVDYITLSSGTFVIIETVLDRPSKGSYYGRIVDAETGKPLPGATVMLADASGGTQTGQSGRFSMDDMVSGTYKIIFSYVGYEPVTKTIEIDPNEEVNEEIEMKTKPVDFSPIVVTGHQPRMPNHGNEAPAINTTTDWEAGNSRDAIQSLSLFSGVQYGLPMTDLHLQGSRKGEHRMLLDGVPLYNPQSFAQLYSTFSPHALSRVRLHKAGFDVSRGSQIAGLVDFQHDIGAGDSGLLIQGDPLSLNLRGDAHFLGDDNDDLQVMGTLRGNYWDVYQNSTVTGTLRRWDELDPLVTDILLNEGRKQVFAENTFCCSNSMAELAEAGDIESSNYRMSDHAADIRFYDLHLAGNYEIDSDQSLYVSLYGGENKVGTDLLARNQTNADIPEYLYARDEYRWKNMMAQLSHDVRVSPRMDLTTQLSYSSNRFSQRYLLGTNNSSEIPDFSSDVSALEAFQEAAETNRVPTQRNVNNIRHVILKTDAGYSVIPSFSLKAGLQFDYVDSQLDMSDLFYLPTSTDEVSVLASGFVKGDWQLSASWNLQAGGRFTYHQPTGQLFPEPRGTLQYDRPEGSWSAKLSGGLYRQFINQYEITNPGPTSLVPSFPVWSHTGISDLPKAWHINASYFWEPTETTSLNLEAYHKWQPTSYIVSNNNLLQGMSINRSSFEAFAETTRMKTYGAGVRFNQSALEGKLNLMAGYDFSRALVDYESQFGRTLEAPWNEPHRFQFRLLGRLTDDITAVAKWQSILGRKWGYRQAYYDFLFAYNDQLYRQYFTNPEEDLLSPYHQLDLSLIYRPDLGFADTEFRLDLVNILDRENTIDWSLRPNKPGEENGSEFKKKPRTMPGFAPSLSIQLKF